MAPSSPASSIVPASSRHFIIKNLYLIGHHCNLILCSKTLLQIFMASILKVLLQTHKQEIQQMKEWSSISNSKTLQKDRYQRFGESLLTVIIELLAEEEGVNDLTPLKIATFKSHLLSQMAKKHKADESTLERTIGMFLRDAFSKNVEFSKLKQEFEIVFQDMEVGDSDIDSNEESQIPTTFYQMQSSQYPSSVKNQSEESDFSFIDKWDSEIAKGSDKHHEIIDYLSKLASPQSELTYLCQHYAWKSSYQAGVSQNGSFEMIAVVNLEYKKTKKEVRQSGKGQNKKIARMFAAAKMLKKIYLSFPLLWDMFSKVKEDKGITLPAYDASSSLLNVSMKTEKVEVLQMEPLKVEPVNHDREVKEYLSQIDNFKSEMNLLLQQMPTSFEHPKMEKMQEGNKWKVRGQLKYRHQKGAEMAYKEMELNINSKKGEEEVAKKLLTKMYKEHPQIVQIMVLIKNKKGIKT